jgi:hypothetical protein
MSARRLMVRSYIIKFFSQNHKQVRAGYVGMAEVIFAGYRVASQALGEDLFWSSQRHLKF